MSVFFCRRASQVFCLRNRRWKSARHCIAGASKASVEEMLLFLELCGMSLLVMSTTRWPISAIPEERLELGAKSRKLNCEVSADAKGEDEEDAETAMLMSSCLGEAACCSSGEVNVELFARENIASRWPSSVGATPTMRSVSVGYQAATSRRHERCSSSCRALHQPVQTSSARKISCGRPAQSLRRPRCSGPKLAQGTVAKTMERGLDQGSLQAKQRIEFEVNDMATARRARKTPAESSCYL